jgi:hypothetical protein
MGTLDAEEENGVLGLFLVFFNAADDGFQQPLLLECDLVELVLIAAHGFLETA